MNLNQKNWKWFKIGGKDGLFTLHNGKANDGMLEEGDDCVYLGAKRNENSVMRRCKYDADLVQQGNCIIFICNGEGSVGYANYMGKDFIATTDIVAGYNKNLNLLTGTFIASIASLERPKYSYGRKWKKFLAKTMIKLPVANDGTPDWQFMEDYMKTLHYKPLTTKNKKENVPKLDVKKWKKFRVGDWFDISLSEGDIQADDVECGNIPLVSSGENNNGIVKKISNKGDGEAKIFTKNKITVDMFCHAFYQSEDFYAVSHGRVNILVPRYIFNKYISIFVCCVINQEIYKYNYGRAVYSSVIENMIIKLPAKDGKPDWKWMEDYIKALPYGDRI